MVIKLHDYSELGKPQEITATRLEELLLTLTDRSNSLQTISTANMLSTMDKLYRSWAMPSHPMYSKYRYVGLAYLLSFIRSDALRQFLHRGLRHESAFDEIADLGGFQGIAVPKGVVGHWVAGNVPILSIISVLQAILTKNGSVVKLSSKQEDWITPFLHYLSKCGDVGKTMAESVVVLSYPGEWKEVNEQIAVHCDVRIAWGSQEAVESVAGLQGKWDSETIIFGPRLSTSVVDTNLMKLVDWDKLAQDIVLFNQLACTSPHAVFVKNGHMEFAVKGLERAMCKIAQRSYFEPLDTGEASKVLHYRTAARLRGEKIVCSEGTEWTLHLYDRLEPVKGHGMKIISLIPYEREEDIVPFLPDSIQTISHKLPSAELKNLVFASRFSGVSRFVHIGESHQYDIPWDGMLVLDRLVRWIRVDE
ncbi:acyl-CoA reductase [Paenibacillus sp. MSJ-34]|uniref:acyl-CoA reductase n=1 Tax=Paenibacillus sp. MSJ-34 TaxID=2841529 RepID=UPI001C0FE62F|nr:acyl-CoA reductase [Paenibacillus sp. MSJ-34]MBU5441008.1 hypothetical protein [Paenibacillus sp. MSJ-34]